MRAKTRVIAEWLRRILHSWVFYAQMAGVAEIDPLQSGEHLLVDLRLHLQLAETEGTAGFNPLKTGPNLGAFRPGFNPSEASTTVVLSPKGGPV